MNFLPIDMSQIRPYVRFTISTEHLIHSSYVIPLEHRIIYIERGKADFLVDGKHYKMRQNDIFYISSGVPYKMVAEPDAVAFFMYFDLTMEQSNYHERIRPIGILNKDDRPQKLEEQYICNHKLIDNENEVRFIYAKDAAFVTRWLDKIRQCLDDGIGGEYQKHIVSGMMVTLISKMLESQKTSYKACPSSGIVNRVLEYIHKNYNKKISLEDISSALNFHKNYLNICMKKELGVSIHKYLINYRLEQAMSFLMYTDLPVNEVAEIVSFENPKSFSTAFKNHFSISPSEVRKNNKKKG